MWYRQELGGIGRPPQTTERDREDFPEGQEGSRGCPEGPRGVGRPSQKARRVERPPGEPGG